MILHKVSIELGLLIRNQEPGASFINKVPRTNLKSVLGHFLGRA